MEVLDSFNHVFIGADRIVLEAGRSGKSQHLIGLSREDYTIAWDRPSPVTWAFGNIGMINNTLYVIDGRRPLSGDDDFIDEDERAESEVLALATTQGGTVTDRTWIPGTPVALGGTGLYATTAGGIYGHPEWHGYE